jgi:hypothetical protein
MKYSILILLCATIATAAPLKVGDRDVDGALIVAVGNTPPGQVAQAAVPRTSTAQAHAKREANLMARRGRMGHFLGCAPGARFCGVGYGTTPNCRTCQPSRRSRMTLIADAVTRGRDGYYYRSRHWR